MAKFLKYVCFIGLIHFCYGKFISTQLSRKNDVCWERLLTSKSGQPCRCFYSYSYVNHYHCYYKYISYLMLTVCNVYVLSILHALVLPVKLLCPISIAFFFFLIKNVSRLKFLPNLKYKASLNSKMHVFNIVLHFLFKQLLVEIYYERKQELS